MGWILHGSLHSETTTLSRYAPDLQRDAFYGWLAVWHWLPVTLTGVVLLGGGTALGGLTGNRDIEIPAESIVRFKLADNLVVQPA